MKDMSSVSTGLILGNDGIWYSVEDQSISYPTDGNEICFAIEDDSFWFRHRNNCIVSIVRSFPPENNGTIFEVGGGNGYVSLGLANAGFDVAVVEPGRYGASNAKRRGLKTVICATTSSAKFKQQSLPSVGLFDVIEHIENDFSFLESIRVLMRKDGRLYVTVPSYPFLWSAKDILAGHFRRYSLTDICETLESAGFHIEFSSYIFCFFPIFIFLFRTFPYKLGLSKAVRNAKNVSRDHNVKGGIITNVLNSILQLEVKNLDKKRGMRFGGSCLVVARRP